MKKYIVPFLFVFFVAGCVFVFGFGQRTTVAAAEYKFYVTNLDAVDTDLTKVEIIDLGFCFEVSSAESFEIIDCEKLIGSSEVFYCKEYDINRIFDLTGFNVFEKYRIDDILIFEGKNNSGQRVQAAFNKQKLTIGSPAIIGSY